MKKTLYIFLLLIPFSAFAITQKEASVISEIIECKNVISDKDKLDCFEKNIDKIEKAFPIATLGEKDRKIEIQRIEKEKKEDSFGVLQNVNPIASKENKGLNSLSSTIKKNEWVSFGKIKIELQNGQVWKQVDSTPYRGPKDLKGRSVEITSASLGSFLLKIDGIGGKFRVRRDK